MLSLKVLKFCILCLYQIKTFLKSASKKQWRAFYWSRIMKTNWLASTSDAEVFILIKYFCTVISKRVGVCYTWDQDVSF